MQVIFHENIDLLHLRLHTVKKQTNQPNFPKVLIDLTSKNAVGERFFMDVLKDARQKGRFT